MTVMMPRANQRALLSRSFSRPREKTRARVLSRIRRFMRRRGKIRSCVRGARSRINGNCSRLYAHMHTKTLIFARVASRSLARARYFLISRRNPTRGWQSARAWHRNQSLNILAKIFYKRVYNKQAKVTRDVSSSPTSSAKLRAINLAKRDIA